MQLWLGALVDLYRDIQLALDKGHGLQEIYVGYQVTCVQMCGLHVCIDGARRVMLAVCAHKDGVPGTRQ